MSRVLELFGIPTFGGDRDWRSLIESQNCPFTTKPCFKVRKSSPEIAIGTCTVDYGRDPRPVIICPNRLLERRKVFLDCIHLLTTHQPGNDVHVVPEVSIPGGSIDYVLTSVRRGRVVDFAGIEFQTLDTTGTVWPERQRFLDEVGIAVDRADINSAKPFGMNWKMTAKTILVQLHHKIATFEHVNRRLVLVLQDCLLEYMRREFRFGHLDLNANVGDSMHFHAYRVERGRSSLSITLAERASTDMAGLATAIGLQAEARVEFEEIARALEAKLSDDTMLHIA